jgi:hypothetical protein
MTRLSRLTNPTYPKLVEIQQHRPDIYQQYVDCCDGDHLVTYNPEHKEADEWGFKIYDLIAVTKRTGPQRQMINPHTMNFITAELNGSSFYQVKNGKCSWQGSLRCADRHVAANPGDEFMGWQKTKQYRYTKDEYIEYVNQPVVELKPFSNVL